MPRRALVSVVVAVVAFVLAFLLAGCEFAPATPTPATPNPSALADAPSVSILSNWTVVDGTWTFSGGIDPNGSPTDVVLEVGPGPQTSRVFDQQVVAAQDVLEAGPVSAEIIPPDLPQFCVRFTATNEVGSGSTSPLCVSTALLDRSRIIVVSPEPSGS